MKKFLMLLFVFSFSLTYWLNTSLSAQNISIQGTLKDGNGTALEDGDVSVIFKLYGEMVGGEAKWEETAEVEVFGGIYSHNLGSVMPFSESIFGSTLYLGITISGKELSPRTELTYAPYAISVASTQRVSVGGCSGQVGDLKYSILKPTDFAKENGDCWVPMDGRAIAGSKLAGYGFPNAVDMSGYFMRAHEYNELGLDQDRSPTSPIAQKEDQSLLNHSHGGVKDRYISKISTGTPNANYNVIYNRIVDVPENNTPTEALYTGDDDRAGGTSYYLEATGTSESRSTAVTGDGLENRPVNRNFYIYIRIN